MFSKLQTTRRITYAIIILAVLTLISGLTIINAQETSPSQSVLVAGTTMQASTSNTHAPQTLTFATTPDEMYFLMIDSSTNVDGPTFRIMDTATQEQVVAFGRGVTGGCMRLSPETNSYSVEITPGTAEQLQPYRMLLWRAASDQLDCPEDAFEAASVVSITDSPTQYVRNTGGEAINLRRGPSTNTPVVDVVEPGDDVIVVGVTTDGGWLMVNVNATLSWVSAGIVASVGGDWNRLPALNATAYLNESALVDVDVNGGDSNSALIDVDVNNSNNDNALVEVDANLINSNTNTGTGGSEIIDINDNDNTPAIIDVDLGGSSNNDPALIEVDVNVDAVTDAVTDTVTNTTCAVSGLIGNTCP